MESKQEERIQKLFMILTIKLIRLFDELGSGNEEFGCPSLFILLLVLG